MEPEIVWVLFSFFFFSFRPSVSEKTASYFAMAAEMQPQFVQMSIADRAQIRT